VRVPSSVKPVVAPKSTASKKTPDDDPVPNIF
jgi:hypothetical protein